MIIHDEVLTGLWRAGKPLASQHWDDTAPDSCILSRGLGAGYTPAAAVLVDPELAPLLKAEDADPLPAMGTMAATPIQSATCLGVLDELAALRPHLRPPRPGVVSQAVTAARVTSPPTSSARATCAGPRHCRRRGPARARRLRTAFTPCLSTAASSC